MAFKRKTTARKTTLPTGETASTDKEVVRTVLAVGPDERLERFLDENQRPFVEDYSEEFKDPFKLPPWTNQKKFAYAWVDKNDEINMDEFVYSGVWAVVTRMNHSQAPDSAFRLTGAVEKRSCILVYRPKEMREKSLQSRARAHTELRRANLEKFQEGAPIERNPEGKVLTRFYQPDEGTAETMTQEIPYTSGGE